jgi:hypothetical protein
MSSAMEANSEVKELGAFVGDSREEDGGVDELDANAAGSKDERGFVGLDVAGLVVMLTMTLRSCE